MLTVVPALMMTVFLFGLLLHRLIMKDRAVTTVLLAVILALSGVWSYETYHREVVVEREIASENQKYQEMLARSKSLPVKTVEEVFPGAGNPDQP